MGLSRAGRWLRAGFSLLLVSSGTAAAAPGDPWSIAGDNVNLRRAPSTSGEIKRQLNRGAQVIERDQQGAWRQVEVMGQNGLLGWVHQSLLKGAPVIEPAAGPAPAAARTTEKVVRKAVNARRTPPISAPGVKASPVMIPVPAPHPGKRDLAGADSASINPSAADPTATDPSEADPSGVDQESIIEEMLHHVQRREKLPKEPASSKMGRSGRVIMGPVPIRRPGDQSRLPTELVLASTDIRGLADPEAMATFRESVTFLNNRAWSVAGIKLFSEIEPIGGGVIQVKATDDWFEVPKVGQESYLSTLLDRWATAKADGGPAGVMLVDGDGELLMHQTKP